MENWRERVRTKVGVRVLCHLDVLTIQKDLFTYSWIKKTFIVQCPRLLWIPMWGWGSRDKWKIWWHGHKYVYFCILKNEGAGWEDSLHSSRLHRQGGAGWTGNLRLKASGKLLWRLPWQEKLPVSHKRVCWKVRLERSNRVALFPLWPFPQRQWHNSSKEGSPPLAKT